MSLLLGIYYKKETNKALIERLLNVFTLNGKRHYKTINSGALILFLSDNNDNYNFYLSDENITAISGRVYSSSPAQTFP